MRKILLFLVIPIFLFTTGFVLFSSRPASVSPLCASCTPGDPSDVLCEDYENSGAEWCSWTEVKDTGNTVEITSLPSGLGCTKKGSYGLHAIVDNTNGDEAAKYIAATESTLYAELYYHHTADSIDSGTTMGILSFTSIVTVYQATIWIIDEGSGSYFQLSVDTQEDHDYVNGPSATVGKWYRVELYWQKNATSDGSGAACWMAITEDGGSRTQYNCDDLEQNNNVNTNKVYVGYIRDTGWTSGDALEGTWEMIMVDNDTGFHPTPGECTGGL